MSTRQRAPLSITEETRQEGSKAMSVESSKERFAWSKKTRTLAAGVLVAGMMAAVSLMPAPPAHASTTLVVNDTGDFHDTIISDGVCGFGGQCSLRAAIEQANFTPGADVINFAIPGTGVKTITVNATSLGPLPPITSQVTIDGYTQTDAHPNTLAVGNDAALKIELDGTKVPGANGLEISTADSSVIKGLVINRFCYGIEIHGDSVANRIEGNFIGTDPTGTLARGNGNHGVLIIGGASETVVGGSTPAARNLISGNGDKGVLNDGSHADRYQGNYIGTDKSGTKDLGNVSGGIQINSSSDTLVGGTTAASRNVVSGNGLTGISIQASNNNKVLGNRIGTTASGTVALGNDSAGVSITGSNNLIGDGTAGGSNTVAFNGQDGIEIFGITSTGNAISRNSVFSNAGLGIDLIGGFEDATGKTANDPGDIDAGANGLQNFPVITSANKTSTGTTIVGTLGSATSKTYQVQFFSNPSGNEGKKFLGQKSVTTNTSGNASFTFTTSKAISAGQTITATATDSAGNTSELSAPRTVVLASGSTLSPETTKISGPSGVTKNPTAHFKFTSLDPDATFECSLDGGGYFPCSSPENINKLSEGRHTFEVRAVDERSGVDQSPAAWAWAVERNS
jgi:parallel beta-helix repeat protein